MSDEFWKNHNYEVVITEDDSPTLRSLNLANQETMHHRGGAYSETQMIYGNPLREALAQGASSVLSVGLGLGYNEMLVASEALKRNAQSESNASIFRGGDSIKLLSFESEPLLVEQFLSFLRHKSFAPYLQIAQRFDVDLNQICNWLLEANKSGAWKIQGKLDSSTQFDRNYEVIFYDAFSSKSTVELWDESFLNQFLSSAAAGSCVFTTYACTGALKRALKNQNFLVTIREGFKTKRDSTLAFRGQFLPKS
jgi:tRNA U34 5-methylaminomethyl-2-thiouridine-forming methyltransferase MnmC